MQKNISVEEAIQLGKKQLGQPFFNILWATNAISFLVAIYNSSFTFPFLGFLFSLILARLHWGFNVIKWKLWAFENVLDIHTLKEEALLEKLIWPDDHLYNLIVIANTEQKERWNIILVKLEKEEFLRNNEEFPEETLIYFSKTSLFLKAILLSFCFVYGLYCAQKGNYIFGPIFTGLSALMLYIKFIQFFSKEAQLTINNFGIETSKTKFISWYNIKSLKLTYDSTLESLTQTLVIETTKKKINFSVSNLDFKQDYLEKLIKFYIKRYENM